MLDFLRSDAKLPPTDRPFTRASASSHLLSSSHETTSDSRSPSPSGHWLSLKLRLSNSPVPHNPHSSHEASPPAIPRPHHSLHPHLPLYHPSSRRDSCLPDRPLEAPDGEDPVTSPDAGLLPCIRSSIRSLRRSVPGICFSWWRPIPVTGSGTRTAGKEEADVVHFPLFPKRTSRCPPTAGHSTSCPKANDSRPKTGHFPHVS